jgi:hypothetical protein
VQVPLHASDAGGASDAAGGAFADEALWSEYRLLAAPLLGVRQLSVDWELIGGDEIDGRIAYVIERRVGDRALRWYLGLDDGALLAAEVAGKGEKDVAVWRPGVWHDFGPLRWPERWERSNAGSERRTFVITGVSVDGAPAVLPSESRGP